MGIQAFDSVSGFFMHKSLIVMMLSKVCPEMASMPWQYLPAASLQGPLDRAASRRAIFPGPYRDTVLPCSPLSQRRAMFHFLQQKQ
ncbi:hypothetical protein M1D97_04960 [Kushneria sp. AK178]